MNSRILMAVPDSPGVAQHQAILRGQGFDVALCRDGLDCVARLRRDRPDVLVLALDLPWGRGDGVLALMAEGELPQVPVVLLADQPYLPRLPIGRYPVQSFLPWPTPPRLLGQAVRVVLSEEPIGRPSPPHEAPSHEWAAAAYPRHS